MRKLVKSIFSKDSEDPLLGSAVAGRYHVQRLVKEDDFSRLYVGRDISEKSRVGILVAVDQRSHSKMLHWLSRAMLSTIGRHVILAIGHLEPGRQLYVVISEAGLDVVRPVEAPPVVPEYTY